MISRRQLKAVFSFSLVPVILINSFVGIHAQIRDVILVNGNPPLTQATVSKSTDLLEWSLGISFSSEQKTKLRQVLINAWQTYNRAKITSTLDAVGIYDQLAQMSETDRNNLREKFKALLLDNLQKQPADDLSEIVLSAVQANNNTANIPSAPPTNNAPNQPLAGNTNQQSVTTSAQQPDRSSELWTFSQSATLTTEQAKSILQQAVPAITNKVVVDNKSLGFDEAIANARKFLIERASRAAIAAFNARSSSA